MDGVEAGVTAVGLSAVARRRLHYFSGFDPRGAAHYHRLCREEAARPQPQGGVLQVGARDRLNPLDSRWRVTWRAQADAADAVQTEHVFMGWDDQIRAHWARTPWALLRDAVQAYRGLVFDIGPLRGRALSRNAFLTGLAPALCLLLSLLVGALLGGVALWLGAWPPVAALLGAGAVVGLLTWGARAGLFWLLRIFAFVVRLGRAPLPALQARARQWADTVIAMQTADPVDEVLLVGHSVGTLVMIDTVDALLTDARWLALQAGRPTALVTLGQCLPFVALVPAATAMRAALHRLCHSTQLLWWDVTALIDPLCFHGVHPLAGTGVPHAQATQPRAHHPRFFQMYEPARWAGIRRDKLRAHFLYLMTPDRVGNFQPLDVLYGPRSLAAQVARRGAP